jgi:hypothetical protein
MTLRILAVIAFIVAIIFFILAAASSAFDFKDLAFGLVAVAAGLAFFALEGIPFGPRQA